MSHRPVSLLLPLALLASACAQPAEESTSQPVVYGNDDRQDVYAFADQTWAARAAEVSAAMIATSDINQSNPNNVVISASSLQNAFGVCSDERFATQPTAANCSGTLIAPYLVLTAGHCVSDCASYSFVFDYSMTAASTLHAITHDDVYACAQVVVSQVADADYGIVRLDRAVVGRTPATVATDAAALAVTTPLIVQGYPSGLPLKIDDGGAVRDGRAGTLDFFVANLDTFGGNSGSGVYRHDGTLVGILVRGDTDYVQSGGCYRVNTCPNDGCRGEDSTYAFRAIEALCATAPTTGLCACGDGTCDGAGGETTVTCPLDCGTSCGDGACNGTESPLTCTADCGFCGNNACDHGETESTCCADCACTAPGDVCYQGTCVPDPGDGDTCARAITLTPTGTQTVTDSTALAHDDLAGTCVGGGANDRVYTFTLAVPTAVDASVSGFDTGMYLETTCGDVGTEVACNDDGSSPDNLGSHVAATLDPGTYTLVVDGYSGQSGAYTLTVTFDPQCNDADGDGTCDQLDGCVDDPAKTDPGACGCGVADTDADGNGTPDCNDTAGDGGCCSTGGGDPAGAGALLLALGLVARRRRS